MKPFGIVIQARMASTRLPGKVLREFCGRPMLGFQLDLLRKLPEIFPIVVATSVNAPDDALAEFCKQEGIECFRGDEADVFSRFRAVAEKQRFENLVRLTADNPLVHWSVLKACLEEHQKSGADLTSTREILPDRSVKRYAPQGWSVDVLRGKALLSLDVDTLSAFEKEHVIPVFFNAPHRVSVVKQFSGWPSASYSVDTLQDWKRVEDLAREWRQQGILENKLGIS